MGCLDDMLSKLFWLQRGLLSFSGKIHKYFKKFHPLHTYIHHDLSIKQKSCYAKAQRSEIQALEFLYSSFGCGW